MTTVGNRAIYQVPVEQLRKLLCLPKGTKIISVHSSLDYSKESDYVDIKLYHPDLPVVFMGANVPFIEPVFHVNGSGNRDGFVAWNSECQKSWDLIEYQLVNGTEMVELPEIK